MSIDENDDLVVPEVDGFWISTQLTNRSSTDAVKLGPPEAFRDEGVFSLLFGFRKNTKRRVLHSLRETFTQ